MVMGFPLFFVADLPTPSAFFAILGIRVLAIRATTALHCGSRLSICGANMAHTDLSCWVLDVFGPGSGLRPTAHNEKRSCGSTSTASRSPLCPHPVSTMLSLVGKDGVCVVGFRVGMLLQ